MALKLMFQFDVKGKDNFPKKGEAAVIVMNHQTPLDPLLLNIGVNQQVKWFIPKKNLNIPIVRSIVPLYGLIIMDDNMGEMEAAGQIIQMLKDGQSVGLFPEGKASEDGRLNKFHRFPVRFCLELKVPYVPVAIIGGVDAFPPKSKPWEAKIGKKIEIRIGKPVKLDPSIKSNPENALKIAEQMQREVQALLDQ
jgi:1-acyl-sn-glycerol-3-phosphate acyltransferase